MLPGHYTQEFLTWLRFPCIRSFVCLFFFAFGLTQQEERYTTFAGCRNKHCLLIILQITKRRNDHLCSYSSQGPLSVLYWAASFLNSHFVLIYSLSPWLYLASLSVPFIIN